MEAKNTRVRKSDHRIEAHDGVVQPVKTSKRNKEQASVVLKNRHPKPEVSKLANVRCPGVRAEEVKSSTSAASPSHPMEAHSLAALASLPVTGCKEADSASHSIRLHYFKHTKKIPAQSLSLYYSYVLLILMSHNIHGKNFG